VCILGAFHGTEENITVHQHSFPVRKVPPIRKRGLSEAEAAEYIGMSRSFLRHARMDGERFNRPPGPPFTKIGRKILYLKDDLDRWLEEHRHE